MNIRALTCGHCGAPLDVPTGMSFLTCGHCGSRLKVVHTGNAVYTEVLEQISSHTRVMAGNLELLRLQNELERLDREWLIEREKYGGNPGTGAETAISGCAGVGGAAMSGSVALIGIVGLVVAKQYGAPTVLLLIAGAFVLLFLTLAVIFATGGASSISSASAFRKAEAVYHQRREGIVSRLEQMSQDP